MTFIMSFGIKTDLYQKLNIETKIGFDYNNISGYSIKERQLSSDETIKIKIRNLKQSF